MTLLVGTPFFSPWKAWRVHVLPEHVVVVGSNRKAGLFEPVPLRPPAPTPPFNSVKSPFLISELGTVKLVTLFWVRLWYLSYAKKKKTRLVPGTWPPKVTESSFWWSTGLAGSLPVASRTLPLKG